MNTLLFLILIGSIIIFWYESLRVRELVIRHCKKICADSNLQLLDQTVSLNKLSISRSSHGTPCIYRRYAFEVSETGAERIRGFVILLGKRIDMTQLEARDGTVIYHQSATHKIQ